jgi:hypothetical protein
MALPPLTHHDMLELVAPFSRQGRHVDLPACDREARRIVFKPESHPAGTAAPFGILESLVLEHRRVGAYRLTRTLKPAAGPEARIEADGEDPEALLARIESIPLRNAFRLGENYLIAEHTRLEPGAGAAAVAVTLTGASALLPNLVLNMKMPEVRGYPADLELVPSGAARLDLPVDLVAVLGRRWSCIDWRTTGWVGTLRVARRELEKSREASQDLAKTVAHLARTMAEPPHRFQERWRGARWVVSLRRATPLLAGVALLAGSAGLAFLDLAADSMIRMLIFNAPPLLLVAIFSMRELPRIEIPPPPRTPARDAWPTAPEPGGAP